jgi:glutamate-1-semialdehyde-2,1-aminomutase
MNAQEILNRAEHITTQAIPHLHAERLEAAYKEIFAKTQKSKALHERAASLLPNGSQHTLPLNNPYPFYMEKGMGSRLQDVDGNTYIDYILSGGAIILGHNDAGLVEEVKEMLLNKTHFHGHYDEMELKAAEEVIAFFPAIEKVRFTASGSEANIAAVKIARAYTGHKKIIKFNGNYHGWGNEFLIDVEVPGSGKFVSGGIPDEFMNETVLVPQNDLNKLEEAFIENKDKGGIAAIICEPMGAESGLVPFVDGFHKEAMAMAHKYGALYIFDEVVTGFRMNKGGAQAYLGINPDLTTLGKGLMNGFPACGAVGGKKEIMDTANTGLPNGAPFTFVAGTLSGNALSMTACHYVVNYLRNSDALTKANMVASDLSKKLNSLFESYSSPFFAYNYGNIMRVEMTAPHAVNINSMEAMQEVIARRSILSNYSVIVSNCGVLSRMGRDFVSCAHSTSDNDAYVKAYEVLMETLKR